jgi:dihydroorotate dehydrogenase (fumarate)
MFYSVSLRRWCASPQARRFIEEDAFMAAIADLSLEHPLMNAAGTCKSLHDVMELARSAVAVIVVGSITVTEQSGNSGEVYWPNGPYSLNSLGLPNPGVDYYAKTLPEMVATAHDRHKPLMVSVAGFKAKDYLDLAGTVAECRGDLVELNLGCPNVWDGGTQKGIACFDLDYCMEICEQVAKLLRSINRRRGYSVKFGAKLSPFSDPDALRQLARAFDVMAKDYPEFRFVTASNTFPNAIALDAGGRPRIGTVYAGMSGPALKPIAMGQVKQLRSTLPSRIEVVGVGGISTGSDVLDYLRAGAQTVQVATAYLNSSNKAGFFSDILRDVVARMT